jgi:hypothetical protein
LWYTVALARVFWQVNKGATTMTDTYQLAIFGNDLVDNPGTVYKDPMHALEYVAKHFQQKGGFGTTGVVECCLVRGEAPGIVQWTLEIK